MLLNLERQSCLVLFELVLVTAMDEAARGSVDRARHKLGSHVDINGLRQRTLDGRWILVDVLVIAFHGVQCVLICPRYIFGMLCVGAAMLMPSWMHAFAS